MPNSIVFSNPGASIIRWGDGVAAPYLTLSVNGSSALVGAAVSGTVTNTGSAAGQWSVASAPADVLISPSSGTLAVNAFAAFTLTALAAGVKTITLSSSTPGATIVGSPVSLTATSPAPPPAAPTDRTAVIGDSLTDKNFALGRNLHPFWWINGLAAKGGQKLVANAGVNGETAAQMLARVNNAYSNASPGLAGLGALGVVYLRGFANNARAGDSWATIQSDVLALLAAIKSYCQRVVILSASPIGTPDAGFATSNALQTAYNVQLASLAASNPTLYTYVDDNISTRDGGGAAVADCFTDGVHTSGRGIYLQGVDGAAALSSLLAGYTSPLVTAAADVYPTTQQLVTNHLMTGTSGTAGSGITGSVANSYTIAGTAGATTATVSKVAADVSDPNQTPWQRIAPTQVTGGQQIRLTNTLAISTLAATGNALEMMYEVRLNALDASKFSVLRAYVSTSSGDVTSNLDLKMGVETITKTLVVRHALPRSNSSALNFPTFYLDAITSANFTGSMGSFDVRNITVRQE